MKVIFLIRAHIYYCSELANALVAKGNDVAMILPLDGGEVPIPEGKKPSDYVKSFFDDRVRTYFINYPAEGAKSVSQNMRVTKEIIRIIRNFKPDVIHTQDLGDFRHLFALLAVHKRIGLINTVHDAVIHPGYNLKSLRYWIMNIIRRMADMQIVHGKNIKEKLIEQGFKSEKIAIVQHGSYTFYRRWASNVAEEPSTVLMFGKIHEYKGIEYLIEAEPLISAKVPGVKIAIVGAGPYWEKLEPLIKNPDRFELNIRTVMDEEIADIFQRAAVVVLPYVEASQSGVLNIAYAFGKPVVVTNVGSLPEIVENGVTGLIVPPRDSAQLADAIVKLLENADLRKAMGVKGYERATTGDLSWNRVALETMKVYEKAICSKTNE